MNKEQEQYLNEWIEKNQFTGEKEPEWTPPQVVHASSLKRLIENILKLK